MRKGYGYANRRFFSITCFCLGNFLYLCRREAANSKRMKKLLYLFLVLGLMMLTVGCTHTSREPRLVAVDSMLATRPDSALALLRQDLRSSFGEAESSSKADRMYYYLLLADACNKCYDTLPSDSVMHLVADFSHPTNRYAPTTSSAVSIVTSAKLPRPSTATTLPLTAPIQQVKIVTTVCSVEYMLRLQVYSKNNICLKRQQVNWMKL